MSHTSHHRQALDHLAAVQVTKDELNRLHNDRHADRSQIAAAYDCIRQGLKAAEVHAVLAVAEALYDLRSTR